MRQVTLLRGVNVGGVNLKMAEVREVLEGIGLTSVGTVLASGNVCFDSEDAPERLRPRIEAALSEAFGYEAWAQVLPMDRIAEIIAAYPYDTDESTHHPYVIFAVEPGALAELAAAADESVERAKLGGGVLYWECPRGSSLATPLAKATAKARYKPLITTRNLRTLGGFG